MSQVLVLYQISNEFPPNSAGAAPPPQYNGFYMPRPPGTGVTLSSVKSYSHQRILRNIHPAGSHGYHWRVRIDERPNTSHDYSGAALYSWWDVQDENARLPVRECTNSELKKMFRPVKKDSEGELQEVTKAAKGAMKYVGKAMNAVAGSGGYEEDDSGARVAVICFKLLDLTKVSKGGGMGEGRLRQRNGSQQSATVVRKQQPVRASAPVSAGAPRIPPQQQAQQQQQQPPPQPRRPTPLLSAASCKVVPTANLMDFGTAPSAAAPPRPTLSHSASMPAVTATPTGSLPNETRAQKLKREYAQKASASNRVWDEVDQRWVEGPVKNGETSQPIASPSAAALNDASSSLKGISLDPSNAVGKSAAVASAIHARVAAMQTSQQKAISELREREANKSAADAEEEEVRVRLEPKLREWSEEHGKKKQLRALLANLHTILWEDSGWKPISLAEVLEESKVKKVYHRASRVVHPDKTGGLDAEKRFVAKRVFDALTQAKVEFDAAAK
ncbi:hypothetical protein ACHAW6_007468 [Cyclotella cf. meneghiniana]